MTAVRRVVTGHSPDGKAIVVSDTAVEGIAPALTPGAEFHRLWGADEAPSFPDDGTPPAAGTYFPPVGGFRVGFFTVPPDATAAALPPDLDVGAAFADLEAQLPGLPGFMEPGAPGMHTTPTVDFEVVVEGEVWLELDDGVEVHLRAGDTVVQNGTRHAWRNHGTATARLVVVLVGAHHATAPPVTPPTPPT
jgi:hypothetical protein